MRLDLFILLRLLAELGALYYGFIVLKTSGKLLILFLLVAFLFDHTIS